MKSPKYNPVKNNKISYIDYIAYANTPEARKWIVKYGQEPANKISDLTSRMGYVVKTFGDSALYDLMSIHPDKAIIGETLKKSGTMKMTGEQNDPNYMYSAMHGKDKSECAIGKKGCDGKMSCEGCECSGKGKKAAPEHMNFNTNYREETSYADGTGVEVAAVTGKYDDLKTLGLILCGIVLVGLLIGQGEKGRSY
jgi:hypothetical protein